VSLLETKFLDHSSLLERGNPGGGYKFLGNQLAEFQPAGHNGVVNPLTTIAAAATTIPTASTPRLATPVKDPVAMEDLAANLFAGMGIRQLSPRKRVGTHHIASRTAWTRKNQSWFSPVGVSDRRAVPTCGQTRVSAWFASLGIGRTKPCPVFWGKPVYRLAPLPVKAGKNCISPKKKKMKSYARRVKIVSRSGTCIVV
jgi:hypothetical protein